MGADSHMTKVVNVLLRRRCLYRVLVEVVGRVDAGVLGVQNGRDLAARCLYLCGDVLLIRL
jgi:hypothetical protein